MTTQKQKILKDCLHLLLEENLKEMAQTEELEQTEISEETPETTPETTKNPETPPKKPMNPKVLGGIAVGAVAVVGLCVSLFSAGTTAKDMRLEKYTGSVTLHNNTEEKEVLEGARLISQDNLETFEDSSAYIVLDDVKVLKADEETHMEVVKVNDDLDIELYKGSLYFSVTEPLSDTETLEFHTNNVVTGVRGTSGVITYTEDVLQSQVVVLSGTVEVVTIEEEPETVLVNQGEIAIATTQEDGSVDLVVKEQEKTPSYSFSTNFLDDSGEEVEEYTLPDWKEAYTQHLGEIESYYTGHPDLELEPQEGNASLMTERNLYPVDLSATTYRLHDMDLDGTPELFLGFCYPSRGVVSSFGVVGTDKVEFTEIFCYALFGDYSSIGFQSSQHSNESIIGNGTSGWTITTSTLAIPVNGIGVYAQIEHVNTNSPEHSYSSTTFLWTKGERSIESTYYWRGVSYDNLPPFLDGTPIPHASTWTHYSDLSGLEWNG